MDAKSSFSSICPAFWLSYTAHKLLLIVSCTQNQTFRHIIDDILQLSSKKTLEISTNQLHSRFSHRSPRIVIGQTVRIKLKGPKQDAPPHPNSWFAKPKQHTNDTSNPINHRTLFRSWGFENERFPSISSHRRRPAPPQSDQKRSTRETAPT